MTNFAIHRERSAAPDATRSCCFNIGRRRFVGALGAGIAGAALAGCAATGTGGRRRSLAPGRRVELLYLADTLECLKPSRPVAPATFLGPASLLGAEPWATAGDVATLAGAAGRDWQRLCIPELAVAQQSGGYGGLAARLEQLRESLGAARTLTLENGQCWSGSGLGHLSNGRAGLDASRLLGSDARVSSDERVLWPQQVESLYRRFERPVLGALPAGRSAAVTPATRFERDGVRVAVVGATDPHAFDESRQLDAWYQALHSSVEDAAKGADLVVLMADTGSGVARWLAGRLPAVDLVLAARGQDFWPDLIQVDHRSGGQVPLCLPGSHASGFYQLSCVSDSDGWRVEARFHLNDGALSPERSAPLQARFDQLRAPYAGWLDRRLATAPDWLWRRDSAGGSWDALIAAALAEGEGDHALLPGLRYDSPLAPGEAITRDHLLRLTGGYPARVTGLELSRDDLHQLVERSVDNSLGTPLVINNSQDLPRLSGADWQLDYGAGPGERSRIDAPAGTHRWQTFSARPEAPPGEPLWQRMERFLLDRPSLTLPPRPDVEARYVDGHPGWHPEARLT
ncbi:lipoprotein UxpA [Kushneria aurantia]|uniref:Lipoprotein UxpA n=1 Tax=Kushneria aurantia TaxID=504092 RepID=A0ABV6G519_9GAMM|nr:lipoprotein UxpA [Kushneria aurantia]